MYAVAEIAKQDTLFEIYNKATTNTWVFDRVEEDGTLKQYCGVEDVFFTISQQKELHANGFLIFLTADACGEWQMKNGWIDDFGNVIRTF